MADDRTLLDDLSKGVLAQVQIFDRLTQSLTNLSKPIDDLTRKFSDLVRALGSLANMVPKGSATNSARDIFRGSLGADAVGGAINYGVLRALTSPSYRNMAPPTSLTPKQRMWQSSSSGTFFGPATPGGSNPIIPGDDIWFGPKGTMEAIGKRASQMNVNYKPGIFEDYLPPKPPPVTREDNARGGGLASILSSVKTPLMVFAAAVAAAATAAFAFSKQMAGNAGALAMAGGRENQGGLLHSVAAGLGMDDSVLGSKARSFGELINNGGMQATLATTMGIRAYGGPGGDRNFLNKYLKAAKNIINEPDYDRATYKAQYLGMEDLVGYRYLNQTNKQDLFSHISESQDPQRKREAINSQYELNRALADFMDTIRELGRKVLPTITWIMKQAIGFADLLTKFFGYLGFQNSPGDRNIDLPGGPSMARSPMGSSIYNGFVAALNTNTLSVHRMTAALEKNTSLLEGVYGGGDITNSGKVIPKALGAMQFNDAGSRAAVRFGALTA